MAEAAFDSAVAPEVPDQNGTVEADLTADQAPVAEPEVEPPIVTRGLYLVRVPKPPVDDSELKKTQAEFQECVAKLKSMQSVLTSKRDARRALQRQMDEARGLKETTQPEYQEKADQMSKLRDRRDDCIAQIKQIRSIMQGVDVKSEAELDKKLEELDQAIRSGTLPIRDERATIQQMSRLRSQRPKIKEFAEQEAYLTQLEDEVKTIKGLLKDMGGEFDVIRSERNATNDVVKGILDQLKKVRAEITDLEAEQAELTAAKNAALEQLDAIRGETNSNMSDYRDNRKFSLTVRDMVAASQVDEAAALVNAQVDELITRLASDKAFRTEYFSLSAQQRRAPVSELLPGSCTNPEYLAAQKPAASAKGSKGAPAGPAQPRGKEKAADIISKIMATASKEAASRQAGLPRDSDEEEEEKTTPAPLRKAAAEPVTTAATSSTAPAPKAKLVKDPAAAAAAAFGNFKVELPVVPEPEEFVPPVIKSDAEEKMSKEQLREEQIKKAAEAEERKKRRAEQAERKKQQAIEAAKKQEQERKEREAAARAAAAAAKAAEQRKKQQEEAEAAAAASGPDAGTAGEETTGAASDTIVKSSAPKSSASSRKGAKILAEKRPPVVKKPKSGAPKPLKTALTYWNEYQGPIILGIVMLLCIILAYLFLA